MSICSLCCLVMNSSWGSHGLQSGLGLGEDRKMSTVGTLHFPPRLPCSPTPQPHTPVLPVHPRPLPWCQAYPPPHLWSLPCRSSQILGSAPLVLGLWESAPKPGAHGLHPNSPGAFPYSHCCSLQPPHPFCTQSTFPSAAALGLGKHQLWATGAGGEAGNKQQLPWWQRCPLQGWRSFVRIALYIAVPSPVTHKFFVAGECWTGGSGVAVPRV